MVPELPELLVQGREVIYLNWFYQQTTFNKEAIDETALKEYVRCYASPGGMKAGFNYYRSQFLDFELNAEQVKVKLKMPVLALGGALSLLCYLMNPGKWYVKTVRWCYSKFRTLYC